MNDVLNVFAHAQNEITRLDHKKTTLAYKQNSVRTILKRYLHGDCAISMNDAEDYYRRGLMTEFEFSVYLTGWHWLRPRSSSLVQEIYCEKYGIDALNNRINNFRRKLGLEKI